MTCRIGTHDDFVQGSRARSVLMGMTTPADLALAAIDDSIAAAGDTVTIEHTFEIADELALRCDGNVDASTEMNQVEFWGTTKTGQHWRVHLVGIDESVEVEAEADTLEAAWSRDGVACAACGFVMDPTDTCVACGVAL